MSPRRITSFLRRLLGLDSRPPVRTSETQRTLNRFRPMLEACEDRATPTAVTVSLLAHTTEGGSGQVRFTRDDTTGSLSVNFSLGGTATSGTDYATPISPVYFMPGTATVDMFVGTYGDSDSEPTETVVVTVTSGTGYTIGSPAAATINILDDDAQYVSVYATQDAAEGGDPGVFLFLRIGDLSAGLTANFSVGGGSTATSGTDYTAVGTSVTFGAGVAWAEKLVVPLADNVVEDTESVAVTVGTGTGYSVDSPSTGTVYIEDDPPVVSVEAADTFEGAATGGFSFTRSGGDLSAELMVTYTVTGTADDGTDYTALSGSVTFDEDQDRVEVWVEAFGDNTADDGETVIATIDDGGTDYTLGDDEATVTIADEPLTVAVIALSDGAEGGSNPVFRFMRFGDLSEELVVEYTVGGTATSGTDYTALAGSVTFDEDDDTVDVTVYLSGDSAGEQTETVTVTLDESEDYLFGNDSDTVFIRDNDTTTVTWEGDDLLYPNDWTDPDNWSTNSVPTAGQDVYFNGSTSNVNCTNVGYGISTKLYGLHVIGAYSGTLTLANALEVGTFEMLSGTLNQPSARHLTVKDAMLWSGGTLNSSDTSANVDVDGAVARIDPPDTGSMSTSSTFRILGTTVATLLPGTLNFAGGNGLYVAAQMTIQADPTVDVNPAAPGGPNAVKIQIPAGGELSARKKVPPPGTPIRGGTVTTVPIVNAGGLFVEDGIHFITNGHVDGGNSPSILQEGATATTRLGSGGAIVAEFGVVFAGGKLIIGVVKGNTTAVIHGDVLVEATDISFVAVSESGGATLEMQGSVIWVSGTYKPVVWEGTQGLCDRWKSTDTFTVEADAALDPVIVGLGAQAGWAWTILESPKGITTAFPNNPPPGLPENLQTDWGVVSVGEGDKKRWDIKRKPF